MAQVEGFPDVVLANLAVTDYLYVRSSAQPSGSRDKRMGITALFKALLNLTTSANQLIYSNGINTLATTALTAQGIALLGNADGPTARATLGFLTATAALDFPSIAAGAQADLTIPVAGASVGDAVHLGMPAAPAAGLVFNAFVSAANTVTVRASNISSGAVDESSMTFRVVVIKST